MSQPTSAYTAGSSQVQAQVDAYDRQLKAAEQQAQQADDLMRRQIVLQDFAERESKRQSEYLNTYEQQLKRMEALLLKWEEQAKRYDAILTRWEQQPSPATSAKQQ